MNTKVVDGVRRDLTPAEEQIEIDRAEAALSPTVPVSITRAQLKKQLHRSGFNGNITSFLDQPENAELKIDWDDSHAVLRNSELITALTSELNKTEAEVDQLFIDGSLIV